MINLLGPNIFISLLIELQVVLWGAWLGITAGKRIRLLVLGLGTILAVAIGVGPGPFIRWVTFDEFVTISLILEGLISISFFIFMGVPAFILAGSFGFASWFTLEFYTIELLYGAPSSWQTVWKATDPGFAFTLIFFGLLVALGWILGQIGKILESTSGWILYPLITFASLATFIWLTATSASYPISISNTYFIVRDTFKQPGLYADQLSKLPSAIIVIIAAAFGFIRAIISLLADILSIREHTRKNRQNK